jgi:uncharacterized protein YecT (DUF1311 family)
MKRTLLAIFTIALLWSGAHAEAAFYWCEPLRAYYPWVRSCPSAWQTVDPQSGRQVYGVAPGQNAPGEHAEAASPGPTQETDTTANHQPTFPGRSSFVRSDALDEWCKGSTTALLTAICGDDQLRALAIERLHAYDEAKTRLNADQQKTLIADQNGWALSYPQACGLNADIQPSLPLEPSLRDCLAKAGQERLQYLKNYGQAEPGNAATPAAPAPAAASPAPATPPPTAATGPAGTQSPATATPAPSAPDASQHAASQNNETHQTATAAVPPPATPAKPTSRDAGSTMQPHRDSSLSRIGEYVRIGAMLIAVLVVIIWAFTAWFHGRSRRSRKTVETRR